MKIKILNESHKNGLIGPILINKTPVNFDPKRVMFFNAKTGSHIKSEKIAEMAKPNSHLIPYIAGLLMYGRSKGLLKEEQIVLVREKLGRTDKVRMLAEKVYDKLGNDVAKKAAEVYKKKKEIYQDQKAWEPAQESIEVGDIVKVDSNHGGGSGTVVDLTENGRFAVVKYQTGRMEPFHESLLTLKKKRNIRENVEIGQPVRINPNAGGGVGEIVEIEGDYAFVELSGGDVGKYHIKDLTPKAKLLGRRLNEVAPPGWEDWTEDPDVKQSFKDQYGDRWEEVLYRTAWDRYNQGETYGESATRSGRQLNEKAPPGMEDWIKDNKAEFKDQYGDDWEKRLYQTAWSIHNKKNESVREQRIDRRGPPPGMEDWIEDKKMDYIRKYGRQWMQHALEDAWELHTSHQKARSL